jgi:hypothetical protein
MKKTILLLSLSVSILSCSKNSEQIEAVKKDLLSHNVTELELKDYKFEVFEISDRDAYDNIIKIKQGYQKKYFLEEINKEVIRYLDSLGNASGNIKFYKVHYYRIANDTLNNGFVFLNNKNQKIGFQYKK